MTRSSNKHRTYLSLQKCKCRNLNMIYIESKIYRNLTWIWIETSIGDINLRGSDPISMDLFIG
jgi:hypothetical protein